MTQQQPSPQYQSQYQEEGGVQGALVRQIGPLKTWQWAAVVGGAILVFRFVRGSGSSASTTNATVPFSTTDSGLTTDSSSTTDTSGSNTYVAPNPALYDFKTAPRSLDPKASARRVQPVVTKAPQGSFGPIEQLVGHPVIMQPLLTTTGITPPTSTSRSNPTNGTLLG